MVQIDLPWAVLIGATLAEADQVQIPADRTVFQNRCFVMGAAFMALLFNPSAVYLLWRYPAWETQYWIKGAIPYWLPPLDLAALSFLYFVGFWWGYKRIQGNASKTLRIFNRSLTFVIPFAVVLNHRQFFFVGTYDEFAAGAGANLVHTSLFRDLIVMAALLTPAYLYVYRYFWFQGKKSGSGTVASLSHAENLRQLLTSIGIGLGVAAISAGFVLLVWHFKI